MIQKALREYEVSIWSLQDEFLTVLKPAGIWSKGQIQDAEMILKVDGTQEFTFSIPMYYSVNGELKENPSWYTYKDGFIIAGMRKIKVILNKLTSDEEVFEFVITKVTEQHDNNELMCDVECEGLAFQELGKVGYKISLASDDFYAEDLEWFNEHGVTDNGPKATLNYWLNKFLKPLPTNSDYKDSTVWYYKIDMDWSAYINRDADKVYDDEYISAWTLNSNNQLIPAQGSIQNAKEKERLVDLEESNKYNLTQDLAETFGVYCRYEYEHDENYYITGRTIIFYNTFFAEKEKPMDINYRYNTASLSREIDSTDLITKMFVQPVNSNESASGLISIMGIGANKMREDYLFNFDYLHDIKAINDEAYNFIPEYEAEMHRINLGLEPLDERLAELAVKIPEIEAKKQIAENAIQLDRERIGDANKFINNLTGNDGTLEFTVARPDTAVLLKDSENSGSYYIKITQQGILVDTLHIYKTMNFAATNERRLTGEIKTGRFQYDETGNLIKVTNLFRETNDNGTVYLIYKYQPKLYYENVRRAWERRLAKDQSDLSSYGDELTRLNNIKNSLESERETLYNQKKELIEKFESLMGPALREGYWQPEDYTDYGEKHTASLNGVGISSSGLEEFIWDENLLDGEQDIVFNLGADQVAYNYPCIDLSNFNDISNINNYSLIFSENSVIGIQGNSINNQRIFAFGSELIPSYLKSGSTIKPILIVKGAETLSNDALFNMYSGAKLGVVDVNVAVANVSVQVNNIQSFTWAIGINSQYKNFSPKNNSLKAVYPRVKIKSLALKTSEDQFSLKYNSNLLTNYNDFSMFTYIEEHSDKVESGYNITIKPSTLMRYGCTGNIGIIELSYTLSNADVAIYLDALEVLLDSSRPQVSYEVEVSTVDKEFVKNVYKTLGRIVNINDHELKFENVQGYVSEVTLYLDTPWEDTLEIKNYRNKFEDLFATIVAQTESMKKNEQAIVTATQAFSPSGELKTKVLKDTMRKTDLNFAFNNGKLTIDEANGIWGTSDTGVVAFRGGGIFTATEKDADGSWIWNTGITPEGISADQITTGQLDTNKINIYAGNNLRFQLNSEGLFAYKSFAEDFKWLTGFDEDAMEGKVTREDGLDPKQYVVLNENGLFLKTVAGAYLLNSNKTAYQEVKQNVDRVEVSWDGFKIRNLKNKEVFYADTDGNLTLDGIIIARQLQIGGTLDKETNEYIDDGQPLQEYINNLVDSDNNVMIYYGVEDPDDPENPDDIAKNDLWCNFLQDGIWHTKKNSSNVYSKIVDNEWETIDNSSNIQALNRLLNNLNNLTVNESSGG